VARLFSLMDMRLLYAPCSVFSCYPFFPGFFVLSGLIHQGQFNVELSSCISQIRVHPLRVVLCEEDECGQRDGPLVSPSYVLCCYSFFPRVFRSIGPDASGQSSVEPSS